MRGQDADVDVDTGAKRAAFRAQRTKKEKTATRQSARHSRTRLRRTRDQQGDHLVVAVNVERNVEGLNQWKGCVQLLGRHYVAVHLQRPRAAAADTARIVVSERRLAEPDRKSVV